MGSIGCRETSARNYHYLLRKNPEERISLGLGLLVVFPVLSGGTKNNHTEKRNVGVPVGKASVFRGGFESGITVYYPVLCVCVCVCVCACAGARLPAPLSYVPRLYIDKAWVFVVESNNCLFDILL